MHLKNVYGEGELMERGTTKDFLAVRTKSTRRVRRKLKHYNLDAIYLRGLPSQFQTRGAFPPMGLPECCMSIS